MSEVQSRPSHPRGRGTARGGRGGYASRGARGGNRNTKSDNQENIPPPSYEDEGETGQLKKKYSIKLPTLKEMFPDWTDEDIVFALEETNGDLEVTIDRIADGSISQWGEVKKKHNDRSRSKVKDASAATNETTSAPTRGGRGRGGFEGRGRGRGDRGRGGRGGRAGAQTNGTRGAEKTSNNVTDSWETPVSTTDTGSWENPAPSNPTGGWDQPTNGEVPAQSDWATEVPKEAPKEEVKSSLIPEGSKKGWASLFAKPTPPPAPKTTAAAPIEEKAAEPVIEEPPAAPDLSPVDKQPTDDPVSQVPEAPPSDPGINLTPSKDELTEINLEQLPDTSIPPASATAASTVASTQDPHSTLNSATQMTRPGLSGYAASALKATSGPGRSSSFQRRVMEQQEAVVMPSNHAVDRAAVQFGSIGLNGSADDLDVDDEREEAETRAQPPHDSPVAPRASLPPPPMQTQAATDPIPVARPAPGLPPAPQQPSSPQQQSAYTNFARYGESVQKPYDPFSQQVSQSHVQSQEPFPNQTPTQSQQAVSSAPTDYSSYYAADQQRNSYQNFYGAYGQNQEAGAAQQRAGSGFGTSATDTHSQYATSQPRSRYGHTDAQNSGHNTPNPSLPAHQAQPSQQIPQGLGAYGGYPYGYPQQYPNSHYASAYMNQMGQHQYGRNRPMFDDARRYDDQYMPHNNQYGYGNQYAAAPYGKAGMYNQPHQAYSYEHSSSPANTGGFNQHSMAGRDGAYGRTGSTQPSESQQSAGSNAFGGMADVFGRSQSGFGQSQPLAPQHSGQQAGNDEVGKGFEAPKVSGPSPSLAQAHRPRSATNNIPGQQQVGQSGLPPPQSQQNNQQGFGGYPNHLNHQYGGLGGLGAHHQGAAGQNHHQGGGYGSYGGAGFGNYYGSSGRGGWGGNYGH